MTDLLKRLQDAVDLKTDPRVLENLCAEALAALRSQGESAPTPSPAESVSQALAKVPNDLYWLIGKGKTHESEPLYACQIISPSDGTVMAEAEHDNLAKSITMAVSLLSREESKQP